MKKIILAGILLITPFLFNITLAGSPYGHCDVHASNTTFCGCFYNSCEKNFFPPLCKYEILSKYLDEIGFNVACSTRASGTSREECIEGIKHFIKVCHP